MHRGQGINLQNQQEEDGLLPFKSGRVGTQRTGKGLGNKLGLKPTGNPLKTFSFPRNRPFGRTVAEYKFIFPDKLLSNSFVFFVFHTSFFWKNPPPLK